MTMECDEDLFSTKDWIEAAILLTFRFKLAQVIQKTPCYFLFPNKDQASNFIEAYWKGDLQVNAREFVEAQRRIKDLIFRVERPGVNSK